MSGAFHTMSYGAFLADPNKGEADHSYCLHDAAWVDHSRKAEKAVLATGKAQAIHNHGDGQGCNRGCTVVVPGYMPDSEAIE